MCTGPARHQPRTSAEVQRENERDVGIAEAVAGEIGRYAKSGVGRRHELVEHYATPGHKFGKLRHWRPFAGQSAVPERGQGVAKDIFHCCVGFAFDAAGPAHDPALLKPRLPESLGFWLDGFEIAEADRKSTRS